jgi:hypothetical protein
VNTLAHNLCTVVLCCPCLLPQNFFWLVSRISSQRLYNLYN